MIGFLDDISEKFNSLTHSQKTVATYFMDNIDTIAFYTLDDIASKIGVSTTTIIRFAQVMGYNGYSQMQKEIQNSMRNKVSLPERLSASTTHITQDELLIDSFKNDILNINNTLKMQSGKDLQKTIDAIINSRNTYILGMRGSFALAHYLLSRLGQIKENVRLLQSVGMIYPEEINGAKLGDVCIAFLFPRYSKIAANIITWFKKRGVTVILFTSQSYAAVDLYGDIILPCNINSISFKNSFAGPICLINYLCAAIAFKDYEGAIKTLKETEEILNQGYYLGL